MTLTHKTKYFRLDRLQIRNMHPIGVKKVRKNLCNILERNTV